MNSVARRIPPWTTPAAFAALAIVCITLLASFGAQDHNLLVAALINAVLLIVDGGLLALAYLLAGVGLGRPIVTLLAREHHVSLWIQSAVGIGAMMWISHFAGMLGLLSGPRGLYVGWGIIAVGLVCLGDELLRGRLKPENWPTLPLPALIAAPGLALVLVAACSPPGALWPGGASEAGGYDVLSYHLQLPKEWAADGARLWPTTHNVYSFLPSYFESSYLHMAAITRAGLSDGGSFVAGTGLGVIACQLLHAFMGVFACLVIGRVMIELLARRATATLPSVVGAAAALSAPWTMVVGSLAYNELALCAMIAAGVLAAIDDTLPPIRRGIIAGFLAGIACSIKPTALFMGAPVIGVFLLWIRPTTVRDTIRMVLSGSIAGLFAMAPWLVRNFLASGNPVFPFAKSVFGFSHWTLDQFRRYEPAHGFRGPISERLATLVSERGMFHEHWSIMFPMGLFAIAALVTIKRTRRLGVLLGLSFLAQIVAWMFFTHLQSRFLLPTIVPMTIALGLATSAFIDWVAFRSTGSTRSPLLHRAAAIVVALVPLSLAGWSSLIFLSQRGGHPNEIMAAGGVEVFTGHILTYEFAQLTPAQRREELQQVGPTQFVNFTLEPNEAVYLLGDATPFYFLPAGGIPSVLYHTTWDTSPLGDAIRAHPDDPAAWTAAIRAACPSRELNYVLINFDELIRLHPADTSLPVWYDPDVSADAIKRWIKQECVLVRSWQKSELAGTFLYKLKPGAPAGPPPAPRAPETPA